MPTKTLPEFVAIPPAARQAIGETRRLLGLSRATVEQRAKVGKDYMKRLEGGRHPRVEAVRLRRVLQVVQQAAARRHLPAKLTGQLTRMGKAVAKAG